MSPVHVRAEPGDFAESVLMPEDPRRATSIAENLFEDARLVTEERGMLGYTGTYKGAPVSVQARGIGCPSAALLSICTIPHNPAQVDGKRKLEIPDDEAPVTICGQCA